MTSPQSQLEGFKPKKIAAIEEAAYELQEVRSKRMALTDKEVPLAKKLIALMKKHEVAAYRLDDEFDILLKPGDDKVSVRKAKEPKKEDEKKEGEK